MTESGDVKISDFGLSAMNKGVVGQTMETTVGSEMFMGMYSTRYHCHCSSRGTKREGVHAEL